MNVIKTQITAKTRALKAKWTVDYKNQNMAIDPQALDDISKRISKEIDFEIMSDMLEKIGWKSITTVDLEAHEDEIQSWCKATCKGRIDGLGTRWLFEKEEDIPFFLLKWA